MAMVAVRSRLYYAAAAGVRAQTAMRLYAAKRCGDSVRRRRAAFERHTAHVYGRLSSRTRYAASFEAGLITSVSKHSRALSADPKKL